MEHGKSPRNFGKCEKYTHKAKGHNPLCGDQIQVYLKLNNEKKVEDLTFEGSGCAISIASTSIMTELVKGKSSETAKKIVYDFLNMIKTAIEKKRLNGKKEELEVVDVDGCVSIWSLYPNTIWDTPAEDSMRALWNLWIFGEKISWFPLIFVNELVLLNDFM